LKNDPYYESYELGKQLGKGGFAQVYELLKHKDSLPGTKAVKVISMKDKNGQIERSYVEKVLHGRGRSTGR
jgi:serine/threonine protein kinase